MVSPKQEAGNEAESPLISQVEAIDKRPRRSPLLHRTGIILALISLLLLAAWMAQPQEVLPRGWLWIDIGISALSALEFVTRSGLRWNPAGYVRTHIFEFVAIAPALVLIQYSVPYEPVWLWIILIARGARFINRLLGDGFVQRNALALVGAIEEEITDRVLLRLMARIQTDLERGKFGNALAESLARNKEKVLARIRAEHPREGLTASLARLTGLDTALENVEDRVYDSIVKVLATDEIENAVTEGVSSTFSTMRREIAVKSWRQKLGIRRLPEEKQ